MLHGLDTVTIAQGCKEGIIIVFIKEGSFKRAHKITGVIVISC